MTKDERVEILWIHYQRQNDINRTVVKELDELREQVRELKDELNARTNRPYQHSELVSS